MKKFSLSIILSFFILCIGIQTFAITNLELREQAKVLYMANKPEQAQKQILLVPEAQRSHEDYFLLGNTAKDTKDAIDFYNEAIKIKSKFAPAYYNIADIYYKSNNPERAIYYYKQAIKYDRNLAYAHYNLGCIYMEMEKYNTARKRFEAAIKLQPEEADYYYNLALVYKKLNNTKRAEKAIKLYNDLIKRRNND